MNKQSKIFQPKVIIGSVMSFVIAAVGVVAVFFPSLLNLEKNTMSKGQFLLSDDTKTQKELWEFLETNQGKVIQLEIAYCADFNKMDFAAVKDAKSNWWYNGNDFLKFRAIDFIPKWHFGFGGRTDYESYGVAERLEKFAKQNKLTLTYYETLGKLEKVWEGAGISTKYFYINDRWFWGNSPYPLLERTFEMDYIGRPPVIAGKIASFNIFHYGNDLYPNVNGANIENGGIGFAFFEGKHEYESPKSKDILISHPSNKNKKYIWVMGFENVVYKYLDKTSSLAQQAKKTCKARQINANDLDNESSKEDLLKGWGGSTFGYIKGTFYIHEKEEVGDDAGLWLVTSYNSFGAIETEDYSREKFELEPFDKKDIELRKY